MLRRDDPSGKICVIGLGYVGTSLAVTLAAGGRQVIGVERDPAVCRMLTEKKSPVHEENLQLEEAVDSGRLRVATAIPDDPAIDTYVICVGTPVSPDGRPELGQLDAVVAELAEVMVDDALVVLRSTVPVGTTRQVMNGPLAAAGKRVEVAFCPERTVQGAAVLELRTLPQIVAGGTARARERAAALFRGLTDRIVDVTDLESAEIAKLACNSFRYLTFAFSNELARLCESVGASTIEAQRAAALGYERGAIPIPGPAGGPCLPKDAKILALAFRDFTVSGSPLLDEASLIHDGVAEWMADTILDRVRKLPPADRLEIALLGVAFKGDPPTDDPRSSPSVDLIARLRKRLPAAVVRSHDPLVTHERQRALGYLPYASADAAVAGADVVVIGTNHLAYQEMSLPDLLTHTSADCVVYDVWALHSEAGRNVRQGVDYLAFGEGDLMGSRKTETVCGA